MPAERSDVEHVKNNTTKETEKAPEIPEKGENEKENGKDDKHFLGNYGFQPVP